MLIVSPVGPGDFVPDFCISAEWKVSNVIGLSINILRSSLCSTDAL